MITKIINKLDKKLKIKQFMYPEEKPVMMDLDQLFDMLLTVDNVTEDMANQILDKVYALMEEK